MKRITSFLLLGFLAALFPSCDKEERALTINFYSTQALTEEKDQFVSEELITLLAPLSCQESDIVVRPNLIVHRLDLNETPSLEITFPLSKSGELRRKMNFLSFKHYKKEFEDNGVKTQNSELLYQEGTQPADFGSAELDVSQFWYCCNTDTQGMNQYASVESLKVAITDSLCQESFTASEISIIYSPKINDGVNLPLTAVGAPPKDDLNLSVAFNEIGNADAPPAERIQLLDQYLPLFTEDADVIILGNKSGRIVAEPIGIQDYLERIAMFKSIESIEIVEVMKNDGGEVWEVRLKEYHK